MGKRPKCTSGIARALMSGCVLLGLAGCGGGGGSTASTPTPVPGPPPPPVSAFDTAEFRSSTGPSTHGALTAYNAGASGDGITVGIIDSGIAQGSSEFRGRISPASAAFAGNANIQDEGGHGTAVATILAAGRDGNDVLGMAWGASIMALRADTPGSCGGNADNCRFAETAIIDALDHARLNHARVVNISLGSSTAAGSGLRAAVARATADGVIIVLSAGNSSSLTRPGSGGPDGFTASLADPAISNNRVIIAVSNNASGAHSVFSNGGAGFEGITLSALGENVLVQDENGVFYRDNGTSFSAPQVAGALALLLDAFPTMTADEAIARLLGTAQDAGASGPDALFGRGILDLARAFAPAGTTSLAGTSIAISSQSNGTLSGAMGDASATGLTRAVAIDALGRAYRIGLQSTLGFAAPRAVLLPQLDGASRPITLDAGRLTASLSLAAPSLPRVDRFGQLMRLSARPLSGSIIARLSQHWRLRFSLRESAARTAHSGDGGASFLAAADPATALGFVYDPATAFSLEHSLSPRLALRLSAEQGHQARPFSAARMETPPAYSLTTAGAAWSQQSWSVEVGTGWLREEATLLGAELAPLFGIAGSRTLLLDARLTTRLAPGWQLGLATRHGWTRSDRASLHRAALRSSAWSIDVTRTGLIASGDSLALRMAQPLRVSSGGLAIALPTGYDAATHSARWTDEHVGLAPRGRQIDTEASYFLPLGSGQLRLNGYWRREGGNIAWAREDMGGAIRLTLGY